jgi:hypothetical protein
MADPSYYRERAGQALRLARNSSDQELVKSLTASAAQYNDMADAIAKPLGEDRKDE